MTAAGTSGDTLVPEADLAPKLSSFDPSAFPVPTGREELWRFTPLRRIHRMHDRIEDASEPKYLAPDTVTGVTVPSSSNIWLIPSFLPIKSFTTVELLAAKRVAPRRTLPEEAARGSQTHRKRTGRIDQSVRRTTP